MWVVFMERNKMAENVFLFRNEE